MNKIQLARPIVGIWPPDVSEVVKPDSTFCISPVDTRYFVPAATAYFSPYGELKAHLRMEIALIQAFRRRGFCASADVRRIINACRKVTASQVDETENRPGGTQHDIDALVACIRQYLHIDLHSIIHRGATSFDIRSSGDALRFKEGTLTVLIPLLIDLERVLIEMVLREADTVQVGRTHLQDAVPITFGFGFSEYIYRLLGCIRNLQERALSLNGKFSGATGTMASISVIIPDPINFQREVLDFVGLEPEGFSHQTAMPENMARLLDELGTTAMVESNLADDIRILLSTAFGELVLELDPNQTGSSAMPHKVNPKDYENVCSLARIILGRLVTSHLNQESNLQRDLRDSADFRTFGESLNYLSSMTQRLVAKMPKLVVNHHKLEQNLAQTGGMILAEAYNVILANHGHPRPHAKMKELAQNARRTQISLFDLASKDPELAGYFEQMTLTELSMLEDPHKYIGKAPEIARQNAYSAATELGIKIS